MPPDLGQDATPLEGEQALNTDHPICSNCGFRTTPDRAIQVRDPIETTHVCGLCAIQLLRITGLTIVLELPPLAVNA